MDPKQFAIELAKLAADTRCAGVTVLDVTEISPITDFFVLGTGTSARQMRGVADRIEELAAEHGEHVSSRSIDEHWIVLDFFNVVFHLFSQDARHFYDLESLWGEAKRVEWK